MKKIILAAILMTVSTSSFAHHYGSHGSYKSPESQSKVRVEAGLAHYELDIGDTSSSRVGGYLGAEYLDKNTNLGYQFGINGVSFDGKEVLIGDVGVQYDLQLPVDYIAAVAEAGVFHGRALGETDTSYYVGLNLKSEIIPSTLYANISAKHYNFSDSMWGKNLYGLKFTYRLDRDTYVDFIIEDAGLLSKFGIGFGFYF